MNGQKVLNIIATIVVAVILWKVVSWVIALIAVPVLGIIFYGVKLLIIVGAIACIIKILGLKLKK